MTGQDPPTEFNPLAETRRFYDLRGPFHAGRAASTVWHYLVMSADEHGVCFPSLHDIVLKTGLVKGSVARSLNVLEPLMSHRIVTGGRGHTTYYCLSEVTERKCLMVRQLAEMSQARAHKVSHGETVVESVSQGDRKGVGVEPVPAKVPPKPVKKKMEKSYPFNDDDKKRATYLLDMLVSENPILKVPDEDLPRQYNAMYLLRTNGAPKYKSKTTEVPRIPRPITANELNDVLRWLKNTENGQWWWKTTTNLQNAVSFHTKFAVLLFKFQQEGKAEQGQPDVWLKPNEITPR